MQITSDKIIGRWIIDRSVGRPIGRVSHLIFQPKQLKIAYYQVSVQGESSVQYLRSDQAHLQEMVLTVSSENVLGETEDFLRDAELLSHPCLLHNYKVVDRNKQSIGRVADYTVNPATLEVQRLTVRVPFWQRFSMPERVITRSAVYEVDIKKRLIVIKQSRSPLRSAATEAVPA